MLVPRFINDDNPCELGPASGGGPEFTPANFAIPPIVTGKH